MAEMAEKAKKRGKFRFISLYRRNNDESDKKRSKSSDIRTTTNSHISNNSFIFLKKAASFSYFKIEHNDNETLNDIFRQKKFLFKSEKDLNSFKLEQKYYLEKRIAQIRVYYSELGKSVKRRSNIIKHVKFEGEIFSRP